MNYVFLILINFFSFQTSANYDYKLDVRLAKGIKADKVYLLIQDNYSLNKYKKTDTAGRKDKDFIIKGTINKQCESATLYLIKGEQKIRINFVLDTGLNEIIIDSIGKDYYDNKLRNSRLNASVNKKLDIQLDSIIELYYKNYGVLDSTNNTINLSADKLKELSKKKIELILNAPNAYFTIIYLYQMAGFKENLANILKVFEKLNVKVKNSELGIELHTFLSEQVKYSNTGLVGRKVPYFSVKTNKDKTFNNVDLKGSPYVIAFSATWCIPCQEYQKKLLLLYNKYKARGLKVVYFNLDNDVDKWRAHIAKNKLEWINVSERNKITESKIAERFFITAIPLYIVVNKQEKIIYNGDEVKDLNYDYLEKYILEALK